MPKPLTVWITTNCGKFSKRWEYQTTWPASWETYMQVKKQQLEPDMEQQTGSQLRKEYVKAIYCHPAYDFFGGNDAEAETPVLWPPHVRSWLTGKDLWWEGLRAGEWDDRGWDGWMASLTRWTWVWVDSGSWWWTGRPGMLQFMGSQRVGHDWATELS